MQDSGSVYESAVQDSALDASMSSFHNDISDEVFETEQQLKEKQDKAEADAKNMLQSIYTGIAEKLARQRQESYIAPKDEKKGSKKAGTGEAPAGMEVGLVDTPIQSINPKSVGSTGDPKR